MTTSNEGIVKCSNRVVKCWHERRSRKGLREDKTVLEELDGTFSHVALPQKRRTGSVSFLDRVYSCMALLYSHLCYCPLFYPLRFMGVDGFSLRRSQGKAPNGSKHASPELAHRTPGTRSSSFQTRPDIRRERAKLHGCIQSPSPANQQGEARPDSPAEEGDVNMAVLTLETNKFWHVPFIVPQSKIVQIDMEAEGLVDLHILLNDYELSQFKTGWIPPADRSARGIRVFGYNYKINLGSLSFPLQPPPRTTAMSGLGQTNLLLGSLLGPLPVMPGSNWYLIISNKTERNIAVFCRVYNA